MGVENALEDCERDRHGCWERAGSVSAPGGTGRRLRGAGSSAPGVVHLMGSLPRAARGVVHLMGSLPRAARGVVHLMGSLPRAARGVVHLMGSLPRTARAPCVSNRLWQSIHFIFPILFHTGARVDGNPCRENRFAVVVVVVVVVVLCPAAFPPPLRLSPLVKG